MRRVALLGVVAAGFALPASGQAPVRAMSFNIRYGTAQDGEHAWPNRRAHVAATIRDHAPHILGVQEALRFQLDELLAALPRYASFGVGRDDGRSAGEHAAILVDTARFTVRQHGTNWLSDTPDVPGSTSWGNRITRIVSWALLRDRATGDPVWVYNLHLDHESQPSRERSVGYVVGLIARQELARMRSDSAASAVAGVLVLGDFNANESNPAYLLAIDAGLRNAFRAVHPDAPGVDTFNGFRPDGFTSGMIDHVLVGPGWTVVDAGIDRRRFGALWASDHFAVWATLKREER